MPAAGCTLNTSPALTDNYAGDGPPGANGLTANGQATPLAVRLSEPLRRLANLASIALNVPRASFMVGEFLPPAMTGADITAGQYSLDEHARDEQALCMYVAGSGDKLVVDATRVDRRRDGGDPCGMIAWAGFPVRDLEGQVAAVLWAADHLPRQWSSSDVAILESLAQVAAREFAFQDAVARNAESAALARLLQESLLPPRLPDIPGLQVAAGFAAGGTGVEVLGDFYDVFPSVRGSWGMVVGDVCGKGAPAAKSTGLARYALRAEAQRQARPSVILAGLNQTLLDWPTDDPRFLTAIYATVRLVRTGAAVRISSAGHPLALLRRAGGRVQEFGRPGVLLGLLADPELHDARSVLHPGDSLILFSDGVTEARRRTGRELYGEERLRAFAAGLDGMTAVEMAQAITHAVLDFSDGRLSDDTVVLVMRIPSPEAADRPCPAGQE